MKNLLIKILSINIKRIVYLEGTNSKPKLEQNFSKAPT